MKIINYLTIILYILAIVFIPLSFFDLKCRIILGIIGYSCLILGGTFIIINVCLKKFKENKDANVNNKENGN